MQSDRTGWNHLYLYTSDGVLINAITTGNYTVTGIKYIDQKMRLFILLQEAERILLETISIV